MINNKIKTSISSAKSFNFHAIDCKFIEKITGITRLPSSRFNNDFWEVVRGVKKMNKKSLEIKWQVSIFSI